MPSWVSTMPRLLTRLFGGASAGGAVPAKARAPAVALGLEAGVSGKGNLGLAPTAPGMNEVPGQRIAALSAGESAGAQTIKLVARPTSITPTRAVYRLGGPDGLRVRPGEQLLLEIPPAFRDRPVYQAILEHRQVQSEKSSTPTGTVKKWDHTPGVTALHFHATGSAGSDDPAAWRYWNAPWGSSGAQGGKYAEVREDWESESHFDFTKNGMTEVGGGGPTHEILRVDALRVRGVGKDPTFVRSVEITFAPPPPDHVDEVVFTPGTAIGDLITAEGQSFGKIRSTGIYPGALELFDGAGGGDGIAKLAATKGWSFDQGRLVIPLVPGRIFSGAEIACGDTRPDGKLSTDGAIGTQGHSRLKLGLWKAEAPAPEWFVDGHSVPPQGVIFAGPKSEHKVAPGDRLVLSATVDPTYLMALRLGYLDP